MDPTQPSSCRLTSLPQRHFLRNLSLYPKLYNLETIGIKTNTSCSSTFGETQIKPERKTDFARLAILRKETAGWFLKRAFQFYPHVFSMEIAFVVTLSGLLTLSLAGQRSAGRPRLRAVPPANPRGPGAVSGLPVLLAPWPPASSASCRCWPAPPGLLAPSPQTQPAGGATQVSAPLSPLRGQRPGASIGLRSFVPVFRRSV